MYIKYFYIFFFRTVTHYLLGSPTFFFEQLTLKSLIWRKYLQQDFTSMTFYDAKILLWKKCLHTWLGKTWIWQDSTFTFMSAHLWIFISTHFYLDSPPLEFDEILSKHNFNCDQLPLWHNYNTKGLPCHTKCISHFDVKDTFLPSGLSR